jgi:hypothetical protein
VLQKHDEKAKFGSMRSLGRSYVSSVYFVVDGVYRGEVAKSIARVEVTLKSGFERDL